MRSYHFFFFNDTATTEIYTLSLHDALPIYHEQRFQPVKRFPFQLAVTLKDQSPIVCHPGPQSFVRVRNNAAAEALPRLGPTTMVGLLHVADELQELHRLRAELRGQLVLDRLGGLDEPGLVDVLD